MIANHQLETITKFIESIGLRCNAGEVKHDSFLPGIDIVKGCIVYDKKKIISPGDLLHEAGHLAVLLPEHRQDVTSPDVNGDLEAGGAEMAAIAWSWAAAKYLEIEPEVVFHDAGYHGDSLNIIENFSAGRYFGVSLLQWFGLTKERCDNVGDDTVVFPCMKCWLRY